MGSGQRSNSLLVKEASSAMNRFKYEIANELNIDTSKVQGGYWGNMLSRDNGAIGGNMVRRMIEAAERSLAQQNLNTGSTYQANANQASANSQQNQPTNQNQGN